MKKCKQVLSILLAVLMVALSVPFVGAASSEDKGITANGTCGDNVWWTFENGTLTVGGTGAIEPLTRTNERGETETYFPWTEVIEQEFLKKLGLDLSNPEATTEEYAIAMLTLNKLSFRDVLMDWVSTVASIVIEEGITTVPEEAFTGAVFFPFVPREISLPSTITKFDPFSIYSMLSEKITISNPTLNDLSGILLFAGKPNTSFYSTPDEILSLMVDYSCFIASPEIAYHQLDALKMCAEGAAYVNYKKNQLMNLRQEIESGSLEGEPIPASEMPNALQWIAEEEADVLNELVEYYAFYLDSAHIENATFDDIISVLIDSLNTMLGTSYTQPQDFSTVYLDQDGYLDEAKGIEYNSTVQSKMDELKEIEESAGSQEEKGQQFIDMQNNLLLFPLGESLYPPHGEEVGVEYEVCHVMPWTTIYGYKNSTAEAAAKQSGVKFVALNPTPISVDGLFGDGEIIMQGVCGDKGDNVIWKLSKDQVLTVSGTGNMYGMNDTIDDVNNDQEKHLILCQIYIKVFNAYYLTELRNHGYDYATYEAAEEGLSDGAWKSEDVFSEESREQFVELASQIMPRSLVVEEGVTGVGAGAFLFDPYQFGILNYSGFPYYGLTNILLPLSLKTIGDYAFSNNTKISKINLPNQIKRIGDGAFYGALVTEINIPKSCEYVGKKAFSMGNKATNVFIHSKNLKVPITVSAMPRSWYDALITNNDYEAFSEKAVLSEAAVYANQALYFKMLLELSKLPYREFNDKYPELCIGESDYKEAYKDVMPVESILPVCSMYLNECAEILGVETDNSYDYDAFLEKSELVEKVLFQKLDSVFDYHFTKLEDLFVPVVASENGSNIIEITFTKNWQTLFGTIQTYYSAASSLSGETAMIFGEKPVMTSSDGEEELVPLPIVTVYGYENSVAQKDAEISGVRFVSFESLMASFTEELSASIGALAKVNDSEASKALIAQAKADIAAITYDSNKTTEENASAAQATGEAIVSKLKADLDAQRAAEQQGDSLPTTYPATEPTDEKPAEKLNIFQRIIQWIRDFFARLFGKK